MSEERLLDQISALVTKTVGGDLLSQSGEGKFQRARQFEVSRSQGQ